jgi:hypothetical protein
VPEARFKGELRDYIGRRIKRIVGDIRAGAGGGRIEEAAASVWGTLQKIVTVFVSG